MTEAWKEALSTGGRCTKNKPATSNVSGVKSKDEISEVRYSMDTFFSEVFERVV